MLTSTSNQIIQNEGFQTLNDFGILQGDEDVTEMAKRQDI